MLPSNSALFEKLSVLTRFPWKGPVVVVAVAFTLATAASLVVGKLLLPDLKAGKRAAVIKPRSGNKIAGTQPSLDKKGVKTIVSRNIFNSEGKTGEEDEKKKKDKTNKEEAVKTSLPLKLRGVIYGGSRGSGIAMVENTSRRSIKSFMVGDRIASSGTVIEILEDRLIFEQGGSKEFIELEKKEIVRSTRRVKKKKAAPKARTNKLSPIAVQPPPETYSEEGFERDKNNIVMSEGFKKRMLTQDFARVLQEAKAEPNMVGGELNGFKLTRIRQNSIYEKAGLQNGDIITEINGMGLTDTGQAIKVLNGLRREKELDIRIERGGSAMNLNVEIR